MAICINCNGKFIPKWNNKCCSRKCANQFRIPKEKKICTFCKKDFILTQHDRNGKFCSHECYLKSIRVKEEATCAICCSPFFKTARQLTNKTCSKSCAMKLMVQNPDWIKGNKEAVKKAGRAARVWHAVPANKEKKRSETIAQLKARTRFNSKDNYLESTFAKLLTEIGITFEEQVPLLNRTLVDFFVKPNFCIYTDGVSFHSIPKIKERDDRINGLLQQSGFKVLRFSSTEVFKSPEQCKERLLAALKDC